MQISFLCLFPASVDELLRDLFSENIKLSTVEFHGKDRLQMIHKSAFFKCNNLEYVCLPRNVRYIGKWVFHGCNRLKVLEIRHDPEFIGEWIINRAAAIRCYRGSKVDKYCQESGFNVEYLD